MKLSTVAKLASSDWLADKRRGVIKLSAPFMARESPASTTRPERALIEPPSWPARCCARIRTAGFAGAIAGRSGRVDDSARDIDQLPVTPPVLLAVQIKIGLRPHWGRIPPDRPPELCRRSANSCAGGQGRQCGRWIARRFWLEHDHTDLPAWRRGEEQDMSEPARSVTEDDMPAKLLQIVKSTTLDQEQSSARTAQIHAVVLSKSKYIDDPNFTRLHPTDLELLFARYDNEFFDGQIKKTLGMIPLEFGLSKRMTSSGGKTAYYTDRTSGRRRYEISVSTTVLFECFDGEDHRPITASGIICRDRLDALQRVMEHELVHLIEMLLWNKSSCSQSRFHSITKRFFGHTENKHRLITPREKALVKFGVQPGTAVRFRFDGVEHTGVVSRINKRATVLVEDRRGEPYSDGKRYAKFYVPVQLLDAMV